MNKPTVFVGSSIEGLEIARVVQFQLKDDALVTVWNEGAFGLGKGTLESLVAMLDRFDFAVLVITADDILASRETTNQAPRDNVMFELGLFLGRLGRSRTFGICSDSRDLKLPSDLAGVTLARFNENDATNDITAALGPACYQIRQSIRDLGISESKRLSGIRDAASHVEGISDQVARLIGLLARSRVLELDVITKQFGPVLPADFLKKLKRDLSDLEKKTKTKEYVDEKVRYLGGHPEHEGVCHGKLTLDDDSVRFESTDDQVTLLINYDNADHVFFENQRLGMEQAEMEEGIQIGDHETLIRSIAVVVVKDPENVYPEGLSVRFGFRSDYFAQVFTNRCSKQFRIPPF